MYLVGAGPGDPGLITVKGRECIRAADCIVYDHLAAESLLDEARAGAELIYVGKCSAHHTLPQGEINRLLVAKAGEGKVVTRLKGGDPFVFGRGGEEAEELVQAGIPFEIVPGVTAAIAVPAYAGIPITHRKAASSFAVITGHEDPTKRQSSIAWDKLATGVDTLVFLMGVANLPYISEQLIRNGRPASTPVAVIRQGTIPGQETVAGTLSDIVERVRQAGLTPPSVIVVGEVVSLRETLRWFDNRPLSGKVVLVTRTREQAGKLSQALQEQGAEAIEVPSIELEPVADSPELNAAIGGLARFDWAFFTSANAVDIFLGQVKARTGDPGDLKKLKLGAIGPATAEALRRFGLNADYVPRRFVAEGVLEDIDPSLVKGKRVLLPRADIARPDLVEGLRAMGAEVQQVVVYHTVPAKNGGREALREVLRRRVDIITFTSSSTVQNFVAMLGDERRALNGMLVACIGPVTADKARELGLKVDITASEHTITGLVSAIVEHLQRKGS